MEEKELKFEESIKRLDEIVNKLQAGEIDLDESLSLFQEGIKLVKQCEAKLKDVEEKSVKVLEEN